MYSQFACPAHAETTGSPSWVSTENIMVDGLPPFQKIYNTAVLQATVNSWKHNWEQWCYESRDDDAGGARGDGELARLQDSLVDDYNNINNTS